MINNISYLQTLGGDRQDPQSPMPINPATDYTALQLNEAFRATAAMTNTASSGIYVINNNLITGKYLTYVETVPATTPYVVTIASHSVLKFTITRSVQSLDQTKSYTFTPKYVRASIQDQPSTTTWYAAKAYIMELTSSSFAVAVYAECVISGSLTLTQVPTSLIVEIF